MNTLTRLMCSLAIAATAYLTSANASAQLACPVENQINAQFDNGAAWRMCWESRRRENIVLSSVHYQPANQEPYQVFNSLRLSQLHVSYDDSNVTYNDVTQFGLGGGYVSTLDEHDCPQGRLIDIDGRAGLCEFVSTGDDSYSTPSETRRSQSLSVFSTSQVGSYAYLVTWKFFADGSVQPSIGAAGALQRSSDDSHSHFGRELEGVEDKSWLSHTHNYYWQIDFDLGEHANDDVVSEWQFNTDNEGRRARNQTIFVNEVARAINPSAMTSWLITDGNASNAQARGYLIEPIHYGHKLVSAVTEPHTEYDFFVTKQNDCERFVSENAKYYPDCDENILEFVNNENLVGEDIVVWHRISFHHVPRNEDRHVMHSHWDGFVMEARNLHSQTPDHSGQASEQTLTAIEAVTTKAATTQNEVSSSSGCSVYPGNHRASNTDFIVLLIVALANLIYRQLIKPRSCF